MKLIDKSLFDKILSESSFDNLGEEISTNLLFFDDFKRYLLLDQHLVKFEGIEPLELYYNKYYYFLKFLIAYQKRFGYDAGIEQQEFNILEEGGNYSNIDWAVVEKISHEIKNEKPS